jgi:hypothetical protein
MWSTEPGLLRYLRGDPSPSALNELEPALRRAAKHHVHGFDDLRRALCTDVARASPARAKTCADLAHSGEETWNRERSGGGGVAIAAASAVFAGAISTAYLTRDSDASRGIATGSGVVGGFTLGAALGGAAVLGRSGGFGGKGSDSGSGAALLGAGLLGAAAGGFGAYALAPVTAGGLVLPYLVTLAIALE